MFMNLFTFIARMPLIHRGNGGSSSRRNLTNPKFEELVLCAVQA